MAAPTHLRLVVVFNHRYEKNLEKLDEFYRGRFSDVHYLMPFYQESRPDVTPVYETSAEFQGYFAHAAHAFIDPAVTHYVFLADDLLLNPGINAANFLERFGINDGEGAIETLKPLDATSFEWPHLLGSIYAWRYERFVLYRRELPSKEEALAKMAQHGVQLGDFTWRNLRGAHGWHRYDGWRRALRLLVCNKGRVKMPYPMVWTYSDLVILPRDSVRQFCHLCGVFAAMGLWVEVAIPTALALSCARVNQLKTIARGRSRQIWTVAETEALGKEAGYKVNRAFDIAGRDCLYIHPLKLSKWEI